jgi:hypothetical protein
MVVSGWSPSEARVGASLAVRSFNRLNWRTLRAQSLGSLPLDQMAFQRLAHLTGQVALLPLMENPAAHCPPTPWGFKESILTSHDGYAFTRDNITRFHLAGTGRDRQNLGMKRAMGIQGTLFGTAPPSRPARRRYPPRQYTVTVSSEAIAAMTVGGIAGERIMAEAVRAARPDARNVAVDLGTIRWTDPKTGRREVFSTPATVRDALLGVARGMAPEPFRFILGKAARAKCVV